MFINVTTKRRTGNRALLKILYLQEREHNSEDEDEDKYADDIDMPGQNFDSKRRITVRNLRIREDTAKVRNSKYLKSWHVLFCFVFFLCIFPVTFLCKNANTNFLYLLSQYLRNLDPNSAYYDPKTRSMRENPYSNAGKNPDE